MAGTKHDIKDLDCEGMLIHPNNPHLAKFMESKIVQLKHMKHEYVTSGFTKVMVYRYVLLMYDPKSPVRNMMALDWFEQKYEACAYSGFELTKGRDGYFRFSDKVVDMILGKIDEVNDIIIAFLGWLHNSQWDYMVFLKESMLEFTRDALGNKTTAYKSATDYKKLYDDFRKLSMEHSKEEHDTKEFVDRFYYQIEQSRLAISPEDYAKALNGGADLRGDNPYGVNYVVGKIKFVGDHIPLLDED